MWLFVYLQSLLARVKDGSRQYVADWLQCNSFITVECVFVCLCVCQRERERVVVG